MHLSSPDVRSDSVMLNVKKLNTNVLEKSLETLKEKNEHNPITDQTNINSLNNKFHLLSSKVSTNLDTLLIL